jgi:hypothetical protein
MRPACPALHNLPAPILPVRPEGERYYSFRYLMQQRKTMTYTTYLNIPSRYKNSV